MKTTQSNASAPGFREFVSLMALIMCMVALAIDVMLPALNQIGADLQVASQNDVQWVIGVLFLGVAFGQLLYGPLTDACGRKPAVYLGFAIYIVGTLFAMLSSDLFTMLIGRFLQGLGAAGPRIVTVAIVRDCYKGREMARVMSLIMTIFILCPVVAPLLGQAVLEVTGWRGLFGVLLLGGLTALLWFGIRQPETLAQEARVPFSLRRVIGSLLEVLAQRSALSCIVALGLMFGAFIGFLTTVQSVMQGVYDLGRYFPVYFAFLAISVGGASYCNSRLVVRFGMRVLVLNATLVIAVVSAAALPLFIMRDGVPPLWGWMLYLLLVLSCIGLLFGNLNAMAMEPFGRQAGVASGVVGSVSTLLAVMLGALIGQLFDGTVLPVTIGFLVLSGIAFCIVRYVYLTPVECEKE